MRSRVHPPGRPDLEVPDLIKYFRFEPAGDHWLRVYLARVYDLTQITLNSHLLSQIKVQM